jgi:septal ring factor EnvC (AmiA/AmiB activator)
LALVRKRIADLRVRREAFERGVEKRRGRLEEEARLLEKEEAEALEDLIRQRRDLLAKVIPVLKAAGEDVSNLRGIEMEEERWRALLVRLRNRGKEASRPLTSAEEIRRLLP